MDLMEIDPTTFKPKADGKLIEGWNSLIWTERYTFNGEFELKTSKIEETLALLPERTLLAIRQSREVMEVETHVIQPSDTGAGYELVISGRSLVTFLEHRAFMGYQYQTKQRFQISHSPRGAAMTLMWEYLRNNTDQSVINPGMLAFDRNVVPNVVITDSVVDTSAALKNRAIDPGTIYDNVLKLLVKGKLGLRIIRPDSAGTVYTVNSDGTGNSTFDSTITALRFDVYDGDDQRGTVVLDEDSGHLDQPKYVFSDRNYKSSIFLSSGPALEDVSTDFHQLETLRDGDSIGDFTGLDRRVAVVDVGSQPDNMTGGQWSSYVEEEGQRALNHEFARDATFDAKVGVGSPFVYGHHYDLGDKVRMRGKYGIKSDCRVVEFIRSQNKLGETGYPTLIRL